MVPGMDHCVGGSGSSFVNWVDEIDRWVETDRAPDQVTAYWISEEKKPAGSRPALQKKPVFDGAPLSFTIVRYRTRR